MTCHSEDPGLRTCWQSTYQMMKGDRELLENFTNRGTDLVQRHQTGIVAFASDEPSSDSDGSLKGIQRSTESLHPCYYNCGPGPTALGISSDHLNHDLCFQKTSHGLYADSILRVNFNPSTASMWERGAVTCQTQVVLRTPNRPF